MEMTQQLFTALGGLGLFLLGMMLMTEDLRQLAGDSLHTWLTRFTRSPATGALTGTVATAILQSSSATTVTTVGFVAAGLLTFPQALGIIFGANLGTTVTGWMVALLGFKLNIGSIALPLVFVGTLLRLFGRGGRKHMGGLLAGFGLIFLGIDFLQRGFEGLSGSITPESFPPDTLVGRLWLVGMGAILVILTQSSSAGVALAMTALSVGALNFPQAACLVIGMNVGTTFTAVLASLGSTEAARRTGLSHTIYNVFSALGALLMLDLYISAIDALLPDAIARSPELVLAAFHSLFNFLALCIGLPLAGPFARLMERLVPAHSVSLTRRLDDRLLEEPLAAMAALRATLQEALDDALRILAHALDRDIPGPERDIQTIEQGLTATHDYLDRINFLASSDSRDPELANAIHALDHLQRMLQRLRQADRIHTVRSAPDLAHYRLELLELCMGQLVDEEDAPQEDPIDKARRLAERLRDSHAEERDQVISEAVEHDRSVTQTGQWLAARRWLERISNHVWRLRVLLSSGSPQTGAPNPG